MFTKVFAVLALASSTLAAGSARVVNSCTFPITLWSVGSSISDPSTLAPSSGLYSEPFTHDPTTGGKAIKVTLAPDGLYTGAPQTIFAYTFDENANQIWYDLSDIFGDAFSGQKVTLSSANTECPSIVWDDGVPPAGSQVKVCEAGSDIILTLCAA
jgi:hypothetical protein